MPLPFDHKSIQTPPRDIGLHPASKAEHDTAPTHRSITGHARSAKPAGVDPLPTHAIVAAPPVDEEERPILDGQMLMAVPSWLMSMLVHLGIVLATALFVLPRETGPRPFELVLGEASAPMDEMEELASVEFDSSDELVEEEPTEFEEEVDFNEELVEEPVMDMADLIPTQPTETLPFLDEAAEVELSNNSGRPTRVEKIPMIAGGLGLRSAQTQLAQVIKAGGSEQSEEAVARALRWIAKQQAPDGGWYLGGVDKKRRGFTAGSRNGATGLALLPFLGAGHTHQHGEYRYVVQRGLEFLIKKMNVDGVGQEALAKLTDAHGNYYSHGLCTIAMCEAYAMTHDRQLMIPAQQLINETVDSQNPSGGGWRYRRRSKGDTSVLGWQLMAAKSGRLAYLKVPEKTFRKADKFLNSVQGNYGATYGYTGANAKMSTTAVGLLSRMYLGWDRDHPGLEKGVLKIANHGPSKDEIYFSYYATQVLHHYGGPQWRAWNREMRDSLVKAQSRNGKNDGSWKFNSGHCSERLYCTSMATMILEVYYRHMPLYQHKVAM